MRELEVRQGNTTLRLYGHELVVTMASAEVSRTMCSNEAVEELWSRLSGLSVPLVPDQGWGGVGGRGSDLRISMGMSRLEVGWWMAPPTGWDVVTEVFQRLSRLVPAGIRGSYDYGQGSE